MENPCFPCNINVVKKFIKIFVKKNPFVIDKRLSISVCPFQKFLSHGVRHWQLRQSKNHFIEIVRFLKVLERISVVITPIVQLPGLIGRKQLKKIGGVLAVLNHLEVSGVA